MFFIGQQHRYNKLGPLLPNSQKMKFLFALAILAISLTAVYGQTDNLNTLTGEAGATGTGDGSHGKLPQGLQGGFGQVGFGSANTNYGGSYGGNAGYGNIGINTGYGTNTLYQKRYEKDYQDPYEVSQLNEWSSKLILGQLSKSKGYQRQRVQKRTNKNSNSATSRSDSIPGAFLDPAKVNGAFAGPMAVIPAHFGGPGAVTNSTPTGAQNLPIITGPNWTFLGIPKISSFGVKSPIHAFGQIHAFGPMRPTGQRDVNTLTGEAGATGTGDGSRGKLPHAFGAQGPQGGFGQPGFGSAGHGGVPASGVGISSAQNGGIGTGFNGQVGAIGQGSESSVGKK